MFAFFGLGIAEIIVIGIIGALIFIVPIIVVAMAMTGARRTHAGGDRDELSALRAEVKRLRAEVERLEREVASKQSHDIKPERQ